MGGHERRFGNSRLADAGALHEGLVGQVHQLVEQQAIVAVHADHLAVNGPGRGVVPVHVGHQRRVGQRGFVGPDPDETAPLNDRKTAHAGRRVDRFLRRHVGAAPVDVVDQTGILQVTSSPFSRPFESGSKRCQQASARIATVPSSVRYVTSFRRPKFLLDARAQRAKGEVTAEQLRAVEDKAITGIVKFQENVGLQSITDGEFRRSYFHIDFLLRLGGVKTGIPVTIIRPDGSEDLAPPVMRVVGKVGHHTNIQCADFEFLKSQVDSSGKSGHTPKVTISSPTMLSLAAAGCTCVQTDDTNLAYRCDGKMREAAHLRGDDPNELPQRYAMFINKVVAQKPAGMTLAMHLCRGNFKSTHAAAGNHEPVAEARVGEVLRLTRP